MLIMQPLNKTAKMISAIRKTSNTTDKTDIDQDHRSRSASSQKGEEKAMLNLEDLPSDKLIRA